MTLLGELLDALHQGVKLRAGHIRVVGINERGMATNLAEAEQAREHVETHRVERALGLDSQKLGAGAFEFGVVKGALSAFELDDDLVLGAWGQIGRGLGLGAAEEKMPHAAMEAGESGGIGLVVLAAETGLVAEQAWLGEGEEAPEIGEAVFDRCAGKHETVTGAQRSRGDRDLASGVFDELALVEDDGIPLLGAELRGVEAELGVVGDENARAGGGG